MVPIKEIDNKESELCFELDSKTISLWTKKQWETEIKKKGVKVFAKLIGGEIIGIIVVHKIIDEAHINYFSVKERFRREGHGSHLMKYLIKDCQIKEIKKILLEVSETNLAAEVFYSKFNFITVGIRKNYYRNGTAAVLKEKIL